MHKATAAAEFKILCSPMRLSLIFFTICFLKPCADILRLNTEKSFL